MAQTFLVRGGCGDRRGVLDAVVVSTPGAGVISQVVGSSPASSDSFSSKGLSVSAALGLSMLRASSVSAPGSVPVSDTSVAGSIGPASGSAGRRSPFLSIGVPVRWPCSRCRERHAVGAGEISYCTVPASLRLRIWLMRAQSWGGPYVVKNYIGPWSAGVYFYRNALWKCTNVGTLKWRKDQTIGDACWPNGHDADVIVTPPGLKLCS